MFIYFPFRFFPLSSLRLSPASSSPLLLTFPHLINILTITLPLPPPPTHTHLTLPHLTLPPPTRTGPPLRDEVSCSAFSTWSRQQSLFVRTAIVENERMRYVRPYMCVCGHFFFPVLTLYLVSLLKPPPQYKTVFSFSLLHFSFFLLFFSHCSDSIELKSYHLLPPYF